MDENMTTYKARLAAKWFSQSQMIDYDEIFLHVVMFKSIRILLAMPHFMNMKFGKWMSKHHSLMGIWKKDVYMVQPLGFEYPNIGSKVC